MSGLVVWVTGRPASGKTTLALRLRDALAEAGRAPVLLDGDEVREALRPTPGYSRAERDAFYDTLARLAALVAAQGHTAVVAATAHRETHRERARALAPRFLLVYVDTPADECERRDPKGLYASARSGDAPDLPGLGVEYEPPAHADVVAHGGQDPSALAEILQAVRS